MGRYDDISDSKLRYEVQRFARILQRMEENGEVLDRTADILTLLGELRRMVFAWEVRSTFHRDDEPEGDGGGAGTDPDSDTARIVREARQQEAEFLAGLEDGPEEGVDRQEDDVEDEDGSG
ncbi:MAG TPA: hypothetical protein VK858_02755 [Longimicrobiales bacterium]|nr:hypothetical protein [Longimicrobiales bacterium]